MWLPSVLVSACLLTATVSAGSVRRQSEPPEECLDQKNQTGTCKTLSECPQLSTLVENGRELLPDEFDYLQHSICRLTSTQYHICCPGTPEDHPNKYLLDDGNTCGTRVDPRIVGGAEVPLGKYPWMAVLFVTNLTTGDTGLWCGGSLISQQHVLTAAHCIPEPESGGQLTAVRLGEHDLTSDEDCQTLTDGTRICNSPQNFGIERQFVHERYNFLNELDNDIALLKLDRPVVEDQFVSKICLPFGDVARRNYTGVGMTVAGYGRLGSKYSSPGSNVLMEVTQPGVSNEQCRDAYDEYYGGKHDAVIIKEQICAGGEEGRDSCYGDSGGPMIVGTPAGPPYSLIGLVSYGSEYCAKEGVPSVNTRVSEYMNWIMDRLDD